MHLKSKCLDFKCIGALLVHDFLKLSLIVPRVLAPWIVLNRRDFIVWPAFLGVTRVVLLAFVRVVVVIALLIIFALGKALVLLVLLVGPPCHHVAEFHSSSRAVASEVMVGELREKAILEAVDDVLIEDVSDGASHLDKAPGVGPQGLLHLLLNLGQVMMSTYSDHGSLEVVDEGPLEILLGVDGVRLEALEPSERHEFQGNWEVDRLGRVGST
jgi:hypothetical protein